MAIEVNIPAVLAMPFKVPLDLYRLLLGFVGSTAVSSSELDSSEELTINTVLLRNCRGIFSRTSTQKLPKHEKELELTINTVLLLSRHF